MGRFNSYRSVNRRNEVRQRNIPGLILRTTRPLERVETANESNGLPSSSSLSFSSHLFSSCLFLPVPFTFFFSFFIFLPFPPFYSHFTFASISFFLFFPPFSSFFCPFVPFRTTKSIASNGHINIPERTIPQQ